MQVVAALPRHRCARRGVERQVVSLNFMKDVCDDTGLLLSISVPLVKVGANDQISAEVSVSRLVGSCKGKTDRTFTVVCFIDDVFIRTPAWMSNPRQTLRDVTTAEALRLAFPMALESYRLADEVPMAPIPLTISSVFRSSRHVAA